MAIYRNQKKDHGLLSFEQDAAFYYRKAQRLADKGNYFDALASMRKAADKDRNNWEYRLELAQMFTEMNHYEQSNYLLFQLLHQMPKPYAECYYGMGCNFMGLQEIDHAIDAFEKYLKLDPDGIYAEEAQDMLDILEDPGERQMLTQDEVYTHSLEVVESAVRGKSYLEYGQYEKALRIFEKLVQIDPNFIFALNHLSLAYYARKDIKKARETALRVLDLDPEDVFAHCNMAVYLSHMDGRKEEVETHLNAVRAADTDDPEELFRVCVTFCELELYSEAVKYLRRMLEYRPYDKRLLHALAVCYYHTGEVREALAQWDKALKISPEDPVFEYCRAAAMRTIKGEKTDAALTCRYQVPYAEMLRRLSRINQIITQQSEESIRAQWREDHEFRSLVLWGLELGEEGVQRALVHLLGMIGDEDASDMLRRLLLNRNVGDDIKQDIFGLLKKLEVPEPYTAYLGGRIIEARVNVMSADDMDMPDKLREVLLAFAERSVGHIDAPVVRHAMELWRRFWKKCGDVGPDIRSPYAWAAALEFLAREENHVRTLKGELCSRYGTTLQSLNRSYFKIREALEGNPE